MKKIETEEKIIENLKKLKRDLIILTNIDSEPNYVRMANNIIEILLENGNPNNGEYEEYLNPDDRQYIIDIFTNCFTLKEQNNYFKSHDMTSIEQKEILINNCLWVSAILSLKYIGHGIEYIDLVNQGYLGIENAIEICTKHNNCFFSNIIKREVIRYLEKYIREKGKYGQISQKKFSFISNIDRTVERVQRGYNAGVSIDDIADCGGYSLEHLSELMILSKGSIDLYSIDDELANGRIENGVVDAVDIAVNNIYIEELFETIDSVLNEKEKYIFYHALGIRGFKKETYKEIGMHFGCSQGRIRQILVVTIEKINRQFRLQEDYAYKKRNNLLSISDFPERRKKR